MHSETDSETIAAMWGQDAEGLEGAVVYIARAGLAAVRVNHAKQEIALQAAAVLMWERWGMDIIQEHRPRQARCLYDWASRLLRQRANMAVAEGLPSAGAMRRPQGLCELERSRQGKTKPTLQHVQQAHDDWVSRATQICAEVVNTYLTQIPKAVVQWIGRRFAEQSWDYALMSRWGDDMTTLEGRQCTLALEWPEVRTALGRLGISMADPAGEVTQMDDGSNGGVLEAARNQVRAMTVIQAEIQTDNGGVRLQSKLRGSRLVTRRVTRGVSCSCPDGCSRCKIIHHSTAQSAEEGAAAYTWYRYGTEIMASVTASAMQIDEEGATGETQRHKRPFSQIDADTEEGQTSRNDANKILRQEAQQAQSRENAGQDAGEVEAMQTEAGAAGSGDGESRETWFSYGPQPSDGNAWETDSEAEEGRNVEDMVEDNRLLSRSAFQEGVAGDEEHEMHIRENLHTGAVVTLRRVAAWPQPPVRDGDTGIVISCDHRYRERSFMVDWIETGRTYRVAAAELDIVNPAEQVTQTPHSQPRQLVRVVVCATGGERLRQEGHVTMTVPIDMSVRELQHRVRRFAAFAMGESESIHQLWGIVDPVLMRRGPDGIRQAAYGALTLQQWGFSSIGYPMLRWQHDVAVVEIHSGEESELRWNTLLRGDVWMAYNNAVDIGRWPQPLVEGRPMRDAAWMMSTGEMCRADGRGAQRTRHLLSRPHWERGKMVQKWAKQIPSSRHVVAVWRRSGQHEEVIGLHGDVREMTTAHIRTAVAARWPNLSEDFWITKGPGDVQEGRIEKGCNIRLLLTNMGLKADGQVDVVFVIDHDDERLGDGDDDGGDGGDVIGPETEGDRASDGDSTPTPPTPEDGASNGDTREHGDNAATQAGSEGMAEDADLDETDSLKDDYDEGIAVAGREGAGGGLPAHMVKQWWEPTEGETIYEEWNALNERQKCYVRLLGVGEGLAGLPQDKEAIHLQRMAAQMAVSMVIETIGEIDVDPFRPSRQAMMIGDRIQLGGGDATCTCED